MTPEEAMLQASDKVLLDLHEFFVRTLENHLNLMKVFASKGDRMEFAKNAARVAQVAATMKDQYLPMAKACCFRSADLTTLQEDLRACVKEMTGSLTAIYPSNEKMDALEAAVKPVSKDAN